MMATEHEEKNKANSWQNWIPILRNWMPIIIAGLALVVSVVLGNRSNNIAKEALEIGGPTFRFSHYISKKFRIEISISSIPNLRKASSDLWDEWDEKVRTQAEGEQRSYLWLIIENVGNGSASCLDLISINYTFNNKSQDLSYKVADWDRRWPRLTSVMGSGEAFAVLLHASSDQSKFESFDEFQVMIVYSIVLTCKKEDIYEFRGTSTLL